MTAQQTTLTLAAFILQRLDEDEAAARAMPELTHRDYVERGVGYQHLLRHDPARVLAQAAAVRAVVEEHGDGRAGEPIPPFCATCSDDERLVELPCPTLRHLATAFADHADYDESWRP